MALNTVKLNGGTAGNPVVLSARQVNGLIALYKDGNVTKDCSGYVKAASGKLTKSEYIYIQNLGFTIVDTVTTADEFTLYAANNNVVYEGKSVQLYSTGIDIKDLVLTVVAHEIVITSGAISEEVIKNRIHISETGLVTVDDAEENATWQDIITIQAYPNFDSTNKVLISNPITIKGIAMSGISIVAANSVIIGGKINVEVNTLPVDNSKNNYRLELSANDGVINNNIYNAPDTPVETAIIAECFLFGGNVATFHVEKKVSVKMPVIICEIKDKDGEEVPGAYISVTDGVTQVITQLANGESMTAVLNRTYAIEAFVPEGYTRAVVTENITTTEVETIISAIYYPLQIGVMAVFEDGSYITFDEFRDLGFPTTNDEGSSLLGAGFISSDGDHWLFLGQNKIDIPWGNISAPLSNPGSKEAAISYSQEDTIKTNIYLRQLMSANNFTSTNCAILACYAMEIFINKNRVYGFLPSLHQLINLSNNIININSINQIAGKSQFNSNNNHIQSCNESNETYTYRLNSNSYNPDKGWNNRAAEKNSIYFNNLVFYEL